MVRDLDNGTRVVVLGQGTTKVSMVHVDGQDAAFGILFAPMSFDGEMTGKEVILEITNTAGVVAYIRAITELLTTWKILGEEDKVEEMRKQLEAFHQTLRSVS